MLAYWDNERIRNYYESNMKDNYSTDVDTYFVKIYIISVLTVDDDGKVNNLSRDTESALDEFEALAWQINRVVGDVESDLPFCCYGYFSELQHVQVTNTCYLPLVSVFSGNVTADYLDIIDNLMVKYSTDVRYHIRNF